MSNDNKALVLRWFEEVWNKGRASAIDELLAADGVVHGLGDDLRGPAAFKSFHTMYRTAFPDIDIRVDEIVGEGALVAARWSGAATHLGPLLGIGATRTRVLLNGMVLVRVERGRIAEGWNNFDEFGMLQQIGAVKMPPVSETPLQSASSER